MRPKEYIERVRQREIYDPVLTFQLSNDFHVRKVMTNFCQMMKNQNIMLSMSAR